MIHVTAHACQRYAERVEPTLTIAQAETAIRRSERAIQCAIDFGAHVVRLGCGAKLILQGATVVTVLPNGTMPRQLRCGVAA